MVPVPAFVMYRISALNNGHKVIEAPLDDGFDLDLPAMLELMDVYAPGLVFLSFPNNPTGNCFSREKMETLLEKAPGLVVVDEAYGNFSGQTFLALLGRYENLVILKTLSKIGLAALRIGFLIGASPLVHELNKVRLPYNINSLSQAAAGFYLDHEAVFLAQEAEVVRGRERLFYALQQLPGIRPYPSAANFIFFSCLYDTDRVYMSMREQGIMIKRFPAVDSLKNFMRVTVGTQRENEMFLGVLERTMAK
jgi:histidinol-phosphate aminotransferase